MTPLEPQEALPSRPRASLILGLALAVAFIVGLFAYAIHQKGQAKAWQTRAEQAAQQEQLLVAAAKEADQKASQAHQVSQADEKVTQTLQVAYQKAPLPPDPAPAPAEDAALAKGLESAGLKADLTIFRTPGGSSLNREDAVLAWTWSQEAAQVPIFKTRLAAADGLVAGQARETQALKAENLLAYQSVDTWKAAHGAADDQVVALNQEVKALHRAGTAAHVGAAAVVIAIVVRSLTRGK